MSAIVPTQIYEPKGAAKRLWEKLRDFEVLLDGPAGTGKSTALLTRVVGLCNKYPNSRHLISRKTRVSMSTSILVTLEDKVFPAGHPILNGPHRKHRQSYDFPNGSTIEVVGLDSSSKLFSSEYDTVTLFEAIEATESDWELLFRCLRNNKMGWHQALMDTNPGPPTHWINKRANSGKLLRLLSRHQDNPTLWDDEKQDWTPHGKDYIAGLEAMTGHRRERMRFGRWTAAEGQVFPDFDRAVHVVKPFAIPPDWKRYRSIDFGYIDPTVVLWAAVSPDKDIYVYREIYESCRLVEDHAREIVRLTGDEKIEATVADHDRGDRETLNRHGVSTIPAYKIINPGLEGIKARLRVQLPYNRPRIFIFENALVGLDPELEKKHLPTSIIDEWDSYIYKKSANGEFIKDEPLDKDNHGMDALRYLVAHIDGIGNTVEVRVFDMNKGTGASQVMIDSPYGKVPALNSARKRNDDWMWTSHSLGRL